MDSQLHTEVTAAHTASILITVGLYVILLIFFVFLMKYTCRSNISLRMSVHVSSKQSKKQFKNLHHSDYDDSILMNNEQTTTTTTSKTP